MKRSQFARAIFLVISLVCYKSPVALTINEYNDLKNTPEFEMFMSGLGVGLRISNADLLASGQPGLYCQPESVVLDTKSIIIMLDGAIQNASPKIMNAGYDTPSIFAGLLLQQLKKTFPCK